MGTQSITRRELLLENFDQVLSECKALSQSGYYKAGKWSLGQICQHVSAFMEQSQDGFKDQPGTVLKIMSPLIRMMYLGKMLKNQRLSVTASAAASTLPTNDADDLAGVVLLEKNIQRIMSEDASFQVSPVFGKLTPENWRKLHLWHCNHHLSFLSPASASSAGLRNAS